ncbi:unnamed protein product [Adineta ricciae]|uniref:ABC transporter domain-containing protein n=1 Tax=Adineta ricciae TaxID=249248 RepID=A0A813UWT4_ADIRI|nr:unnamed protein product [Adineta ricciae]CAF1072789.1 unnamed protein product [Adineta ricciae]
MSFYHLRLLIQKSARYAWRRRIFRCYPKIVFELFVPIICILLLCLLRWMYSPSSQSGFQNDSLNSTASPRIQISPTSIISPQDSFQILNYTSVYRCPSSNIAVVITSEQLFKRFTRLCPRSHFILSSRQSDGQILLNTSVDMHQISYRCLYNNPHWCWKINLLAKESDTVQIQHPSASLCSHLDTQGYSLVLKAYLSLESLLNIPSNKQQLLVYTWPCSSYVSDALFSHFPRFTFIIILILVDGCIMFSFNFLFQELIEEKRQGITELLRLLSVRPLLNSLAWFLRVLIIQLLTNAILIFTLKISFDGAIYLAYVTIWLIIPTILLWTIHVLSRSILVAHVFNSVLKASLWSWFIYFISFWLAVSSSVQLPLIIHLIASIWLPFYSIKRIFVVFIQVNTNAGRHTDLLHEIIYIWICMIFGTLLFWLLAFYFERIRPGKYGIARSWSWPLDYIRKKQSRRESTDLTMVEMPSKQQTTVRINNLTKSYGRYGTERQVAVDHISFTLENSTIYGLIGHNGAGKTTTMEMICGLLSCDCGTVEIHNKNLSENLHELQACIGYCPQQDMLFSHLTVREQLEFYARIRSKGNTVDNNQIEALLGMMSMNEHDQKLCHTLSGGMQRKLSIACAFVGQANIIVLDEPSASLDPAARRMLWTWLREHKTNRTLLISSHLLDEVEELCDSVIILDAGKIQAQGTILELKQQYGPSGDRLHLDQLPNYIPNEWIIDENNQYVHIPDRQQLITLLKRLEKDNIHYSLMNTTLDDVFLRLASSESPTQDEGNLKSQIDILFTTRTNSRITDLWLQQVLGVFIRRSQIFLRRARLLPIVLILYLLYALAPIYLPSFNSSTQELSYIISSPLEHINAMNLRQFPVKTVPFYSTSKQFQEYLQSISPWQSNHGHRKRLIAVRINSFQQMECYVPPPALSNIISSCLSIFSVFSNRSISPLQLIGRERGSSLPTSSDMSSAQYDSPFFCFYTLPPSMHLSIFLLSLILIVCAAFIIHDYASGLHSYSLIHNLRSPINWLIIFLSDLLLCLIWLLILILIARFVHSSTFNGRFFALTPLFFIVNLPFIYLLAKFFKAPVLGATVIIFILQLALVLNAFKTFIELFRGYPLLSLIVHIVRWSLLLLFPNVNVFILIVAVLRKSYCQIDESILGQGGDDFSHERYPYKILIHTLIFVSQFVIYFFLLIMVDLGKVQISMCERKIKIKVRSEAGDDDVLEEKTRIKSMSSANRRKQALVLDSLTKLYREAIHPAVNQLSFAVPRGQCFGLLGFNGSGKTTTFRMLVGELHSTDGRIYRNRHELIGYCPQNDIAFPALTVAQTIDYICRIHGIEPSVLNNIILSQFQLGKYRHRLVSNLSGGTQRRLHLALCLIGSPTLLLLDEPTAKVDPVLRSHIRLILQHRPINTAIIFASHSMLECEQLCERLTILVRGNARCLGSIDRLKTKYGANYRVRLTLLESSVQVPSLISVENSNEYVYPKGSLAELFTLLEGLVEQHQIAANYTVQLTSLEHIFLTFQHSM